MLRRFHIAFMSIVSIVLGMLLLPAHLSAQSVSELKDKAQRFQADSESLYRLDDDDHQQIWEAYCGVFDPKIQEDREFAADIARQLQSKETGSSNNCSATIFLRCLKA